MNTVVLPRQEAAPVRVSAKPAPRAAKEPAQTARAGATTPAKPRSVQTAARGSAEKKTDKKVEKKADKNVNKAQRTALRTAKTAPQRSSTKPAADAARQRKLASAAPQVDNDVALISAIISQSERHRSEREGATACKGAKCPPKPTQP